MFRNRALGAFVAAIWMALVVWPQPTFANTVDNPGPFTVTAVTGHFQVGSQRLDFDPANPPSLSGSVDMDGNVMIPLAGHMFPDFVIPTPLPPPFDNLIVRVVALANSTGILIMNPITGDSNVITSLQIQLVQLPGCVIGPINATLTTGSSGALTGVPYDQTNGTATYVSNDFDIPGSSGCGGFGGLIDMFLSLPSPMGNNEILVVAQFDPIFTGS